MIKWPLMTLGAVVLVLVGVLVIGSLLPQGHVATREATFNQPIAEVYAAITDVSRYPEWRTDVRAVRVLSNEPRRWTEEGANGAITFEVEEAVPPRRLVVRIADPDLPFGGRWTYDLTPAASDSTRLVITEHGEVYNPLFRFVSRFVLSHTATIDAYLRHLGQRLEGHAGGPR